MNTTTTNTSATANYLAAADGIITLIETMGFLSEEKPDVEMIRQTIAQIIRQNVEKPAIFASEVTSDNEPDNGCCGGSCGCHNE